MDNDKDEAGQPANGVVRPAGMAYAMRAEADAVLNGAAFRRSPVIAKLLRFLIEETLNGRAHLLKSYTVAVDGLGRPADFDVGDSYARVQMGRLRKMLLSHYAEHGPVDALCIYLQPGSYGVKLGQLATAYPTLYRPLSAAIKATTLPGPELTGPVAPARSEPSIPVIEAVPRRLWRYLGGGAILSVVAISALGFAWQASRTADSGQFSPVLELMPVDVGEGEDLAKIARIVSTSFADGLPRFKLARIRVLQTNAIAENSNIRERVYRLNTQIERGEAKTNILLLRLTDASTNTTIWSREKAIPKDPAKVDDTIIPLLAEVNGPFGIIASGGTMLFKDDDSGGYSCLIKYFEFLKNRDRNVEAKVAACFQKPVKEIRLRGSILAARAFFALENENAQKNMDAAMIEARQFAQRALTADPNDAAARYAAARLAYFAGDCVSARFHTKRAVEANPNSPIIVTNLATLAPQCGYKDAGKLLDRAFLTQPAGNANGRLLLVLAALSQQRFDKIAEIAEIGVSRSGRQRANYYLSETLIAAAQDRREDAARNWQLFSRALPANQKTPDQKLQRLILSPVMRAKLVQYLASKQVFEARLE